MGSVILHALQQAGPALTPQSFLRALETVRGKQMGLLPDVTFTPTKHHGVEQQRTVQWQMGCRCWKVAGRLGPLFVP
jgi:hypothetical protein